MIKAPGWIENDVRGSIGSKERCSLSGAGPRELDPARSMNEMLPNERLLVDSSWDARMLKQKCVSKTARHVQWVFGR